MWLFAKLKQSLLSIGARDVANGIFKKFPFFHLSKKEFCERCLTLQCCGAGIVLGYPQNGFEVRIVEVNHPAVFKRNYDNLPLGHFGEIVYQKDKNFQHTGLFGFFDQRGRVWCCGPIADTATILGRRYFPYCIEPLYKHLLWIKHAKMVLNEDKKFFSIKIIPYRVFRPLVKIFRPFFIKKLKIFSQKFAITSGIEKFEID